MKPLPLAVLITISIILVACKPSHYQLNASVISGQGYGVVIYDPPIVRDKHYYSNIDLTEPNIRIYPMIPGEYDYVSVLPPFKGHEGKQLPDTITLNYQYAEISECGISRQGVLQNPVSRKGADHTSSTYYTKHKCKKWKLIPDRIYSKTIDLSNLNDSAKMEALGRIQSNGNTTGVRLILEFFDNGEVIPRLEATTNNRWK